MKYFSQLNTILTSKQKKTFIYLTFIMLFSVFLEILTLNSLFLLLSFFSNPTSLENNQFLFFFKNINFSNLGHLEFLSIFFIIFFIKTIINLFLLWKEHSFINNVRAEISNDFFKGYIYLPRIFHLRTNIAETTKNITTEVDVLVSALLSISVITLEALVLLGLIIFLMFISFKITIISFLSLLFFSYLINFFNANKLLTLGKSRVKLYELRLRNIIEGVAGAKIFALTGSQEKLVTDFNKVNNNLAKNNTNSGFRNSIPRPLFEVFILLIVLIFLIFFLGENTIYKNIVPTLGVFLTAAYRLAPSLGKILTNIQKFQYSIQSAEKLCIDKQKFNKSIESSSEKKTIIFSKGLQIKDLSFSYEKNFNSEKNLILKNINLEIKPGEKIGIVGASGSGKSTLIDLMMGIVEPQRGEILIDNFHLNKIKKNWFEIIGCVPQDVFILDQSLKRNIAFGLSDDKIDTAKVERVIEIANLKELKDNLKHGLNNLVGDKGSRLSGGQRQRIGIARALYNDPDILFFDEATSSLDPETEKKIINEIFNKQKKVKTIIFVSHNKDNLKFCDKILEVKNNETNFLSI